MYDRSMRALVLGFAFATGLLACGTPDDGAARTAVAALDAVDELSATAEANPVIAPPAARIMVAVTWATSDSDIDLHLVNRSQAGKVCDGRWSYSTYNKQARWFADEPAANPHLGEDDRSGPGMEVLAIERPRAGTYRVFAHYCCSVAASPTPVTISVYAGGVLLGEYTRVLGKTDLWAAVDIVVADGFPTIVNELVGDNDRHGGWTCAMSEASCDGVEGLACDRYSMRLERQETHAMLTVSSAVRAQ
jgi:hypothetical protein